MDIKKSIYQCIKCKKIFKSKIDMSRHTNRITPCDKNVTHFTCPKCNKTFSFKSSLKRHLSLVCDLENLCGSSVAQLNHTPPKSKTNNKVNRVKSDITAENMCKCSYCNKTFTRKDSLNRHIDKYCDMKKKLDQNREETFLKLLEEKNTEIENLKQQLQDAISKNLNIESNTGFICHKVTNTNNININSINTVNNIQNNFYIIQYGKENLEHIDETTYKNILNKGYKSVQEYVRLVHYDTNHPEHHNIYIPNIKNNYVMVYDGQKWDLKDRDEIIDDMYDLRKSILIDKFEELYNNLPKHAQNKFKRFIDSDETGDTETIKTIKKELKLILFNNRKMVTDLRNIIKN